MALDSYRITMLYLSLQAVSQITSQITIEFSIDFLACLHYLRCGVLHFAVLEGIVGAILAIISASLARQDQWKRRARCLLHRHVGQIGAYESIRGGIHFKHCSRRLVIDILVHSEWAHTRAQTQYTIHNAERTQYSLYGSKRCRRHRTL